jgi:LPXTG-site transpeptidase (sortase) family protein
MLVFVLLAGIMIIVYVATVFAAQLPDWAFGANPRAQYIHTAPSFDISNHFTHNSELHNSRFNSYQEGDFIGRLIVERLDKTINIYEGETMRNMDFGAGRFSFSGLNYGNLALIGHNRGSNGFFNFVRHLEYGDILTVETSQGTRRFIVTMHYFIHETDFSPLMDFGDCRLTLITCREGIQDQRRVVTAILTE